MSEVDRLSNSGLYPALPIQDRQGKGGGKAPPDPRAKTPDAAGSARTDAKTPRPPKSIIDDYA